jgi:hypothetical protein
MISSMSAAADRDPALAVVPVGGALTALRAAFLAGAFRAAAFFVEADSASAGTGPLAWRPDPAAVEAGVDACALEGGVTKNLSDWPY